MTVNTVSTESNRRRSVLGAGAAMLLMSQLGHAAEQTSTTFELYGFVMLDMGYEAGQSDPDWFDVLRPTKLPSFENEFGEDGHFFAGVRQTRFGERSTTPTGLGDLKTNFEFELFGTGADAGQTTFRLRHAYGELGQFGAGQTWSPFVDADMFPNSIEAWGPTGIALFRNVQLRWMPIKGDTRLTLALERPGASADQGDYADRIALQGVRGRFPYPDISGEYRLGREWGYIEVAGLVRWMEWDDTVPNAVDLSGDAVGWGINLSSNVKVGKHLLRLSLVYGEGIQNYMNDAPQDVGVRPDSNPTQPIVGEALPVLGVTAFIELNWSDAMTSTVGYSYIDIDNSSGQSANAFKRGDYALANVMFYPVKNLLFGPELQYGRRENFRDGFSSDDVRLQFSVKYNFGHTFGGG